ncbi:MAG: DUF3467 domain-containing protein [Burkholderiales bacterium]
MTLQLTDRLVISPYAAKRMSMLLNHVDKEYESRFGPLNIDVGAGGDAKK